MPNEKFNLSGAQFAGGFAGNVQGDQLGGVVVNAADKTLLVSPDCLYTPTQIKAAKKNAQLHGFNQSISDELATQFLDWYHTNKDEPESEVEAIIRGLAQDFEGSSSIANQIEWWKQHLGQAFPTPGQIYRHRQHDPDAGHWHEYKVVAIVLSFTQGVVNNQLATHFYYPGSYRNTNTERLHTLTSCGSKVFSNVSEPHVAYKNTRPNQRDLGWVNCLRPLDEFMDGRFTLIERA